MKSAKAPDAPDPAALAGQQAAANSKTAQTQQQLNMIDQYTPQGSLKYSTTETWPDGTPKYSATQAYSPDQQKLYDLGNQTEQTLGQIGVDQSKRIQDLLSTPYSATTGAESQIAKLQKGFLDPQWAQQSDSLETQLINKGVRPGSEAYTRAMSDFSKQRQSAYDQSYLDSYSAANQAALTERNQPINEISALLSNSQVSNPSYANTPTTGVAPTDLIGATQMALNQANINAQMKQQSNMGLMSGIFGLGNTGLRGAMGGWGK